MEDKELDLDEEEELDLDEVEILLDEVETLLDELVRTLEVPKGLGTTLAIILIQMFQR